MYFSKRTALSCLLVWVLAGIATACSIPVFRYALEHWHPDLYQIAVFHDQDLTEDQRQQLDWLRQQERQGANVSVSVIDLRQATEQQDLEFWGAPPRGDSPQVVVKLPVTATEGRSLVGIAPWQEDTLRSLVYSPIRQEIAERLVAGEVVWLLLESGNGERDDQAYQILEREVAKQQQTAKLPVIDDADRKDLGVDPAELKVQFSTLRVSRDDPAEKWFVEMLLSVEADLRDDDLIDHPMVFPLFGRGRALYALIGAGINPEVIAEAALFLTGDCQCTVKAENPGIDLLLPVRWDELVEVAEPEEVDLPLVGLGLPLVSSDADTINSGVKAATNQTDRSSPETKPGGKESTGEKLALLNSDVDEAPTNPSTEASFDASGQQGQSLLVLPLAVLGLIFFLASVMGLLILRRA